MKPRDYQIEAVASIYTFFQEKDGNPVVAMPTGTGKSVVIAEFLRSIYVQWPMQRVMMLTHVKELIEQNFDKLKKVWPTAPAGVYSAGLNKRDHMQQITFAGIASVAKKAALFGHIDLILIDECHLVSPSESTMYRAFIDALARVNPLIKVIGFTATAWRLGHGKLTEEGGLFTDTCFDITGLEAFNRLIAEGYLMPLIPRKTSTTLDTEGVHMRGGDFVASELQVAVDKQEITYAALRETMELGHDRRKWLIFAAGVEHAKHVGEMLNSMGVTCGVVHGELSSTDRSAVLEAHKRGDLRAVVNNNILTTGYDDPEIDLIVMLRPTASPILWVQALGRGTRPLYTPGFDIDTIEGRLASIAASPKHNCLVLDFAGNTKRLGPINDPVVPRKKGDAKGEAPVKECDYCGTYNHASVRVCMHCGKEFPLPTTKIVSTASAQELIKGDLPVIETFHVDHITFSKHTKVGAPAMLKASYYCGLRVFNEFVCVEHAGYPLRKAKLWWREREGRADVDPPPTADEALVAVQYLRVPTHLRVHVNKQYPEILAVCFDGSAFSTQPVGTVPPPAVQANIAPAGRTVAVKGDAGEVVRLSLDDLDDDIPF